MTRRPLSEQHKEFARQFLLNLANGSARGNAATEAAKKAGYKGSSIADNARKLSHDKRIKDYMLTLSAPPKPAEIQAKEAAVIATVEQTKEQLSEIILAALDLDKVKPADKVAAARTLGEFEGWKAPEKHEIDGVMRIGSITNTIVDPKERVGHTDGESVQAALDAGTL